MLEALIVGAGGFFGSIARYLVNKAFEAQTLGFPLATLLVNGLASFLLGILLALTTQSGLIPERLRLFVAVGVLGGFSTFSAFSGETLLLLQNGSYAPALLNIVLNVGISLALAALGFWLAGALLKAMVQ